MKATRFFISSFTCFVLGTSVLSIVQDARATAPITTGLALHLDAGESSTMTLTGTRVDEWRDLAGGTTKMTRRAGSPTLIASGIGGLPTVHFDNSSWMNDSVNHSAPATVFYVSKQSGGANSRVLGAGGNNWLLGYHGGQRNRFYFEGWVYGNGNGLPSDTSPHLFAATIGGSGQNSTVWAEGTQLASNQSGVQGPNNLELNGYANGGELSNCDISEVLVYNRVLTGAELNQVGGYLTAKYGLTTAYPPLNLTVQLDSPANSQAYPTGTEVTSSATIISGTAPYNVSFYQKTGAGAFVQVGSSQSGAGPTFTQSLGVLADGTYQIYCSATDSAGAPATANSATNTFTVAPPVSTGTSLATSGSPSTYGQSVTFTATVSPTPTGGTIQFYSDASPIGGLVPVNTGTGTASYSTSLLAVPTHSITAHFSGHGVYLPSDAATLAQTVNQAVLTVTADNKVRAPGTANPTFTYKISGYQNGESSTSAGITGAPDLSTLADTGSPEGNYAITCTTGNLAAPNYSFLTLDGNLNVMAGAPPVAGGMACWYEASLGITTDGSGVSTWNDQSGNGHTATRASGTVTLASNAVNSRPAVQLRGNNSYMNCAGGMFTKEQYLVVRSPNANWNGSGSFLGRRSNDFLSVRSSSYNMSSGTTGFWQDHYPSGVTKNGASVPLNASGGAGFRLGTITDYMVLKITVDASANAANLAQYPLYQIGKNETLGTMDFDVAEIIGYDHALTSGEEIALGSYLADKYRVTTTYPLLNVPPAPAGLTAAPLLHSIKLDWTAAYSAASYNIYRGTATGVYAPTPIANVSSVTYTDSAVVDDTPYFYVVKAVNVIGEGSASNQATAAPTSGKVAQSITFGPLASKTYGDAPFELTGTASSLLPVSYASSDDTVASVSGSTVTILKAGTTTITASQPGDVGFYAATPVDQTLTVSKATQTLSFALSATLVRGINDPAFSDAATGGGSGNPVTYTSTNTSVANVDTSGNVTIVGVGITEIQANQAGDADRYDAAPQISQTLTVIPALLPVTSGLACWYDASKGVTTDGSGVASWEDSSTLGHTATRASGAPTLAANDVNGWPAVHLRGNATYFNCAGGMFTKEQYLVVRSPNPTWNGSGSFLGRRSNDFLSVRSSSYNMAGGTDGFWQDHHPAAVSKNGVALPLNNSGGSGYHLSPLTDYMILKIIVDSGASAANLAQYPFYQIGKNETLGTMDFDVAEIIGYDRVLSTEEENAVGGYLENKYGLDTTYIGNPYFAWAASYNLVGGDAAPGFDFDQDGLANGIEFVVGSDPKSGSPSPLRCEVSGSDVLFIFERAVASKNPNTAVAIEVSPDMTSWPEIFEIPNASAGQVDVLPNGATETIILTVPRGADIRKYARLRVQIDP